MSGYTGTAAAPFVNLQTGQDLGIPLVGVVDIVSPDASGPEIVGFKHHGAIRRAAGRGPRGPRNTSQLLAATVGCGQTRGHPDLLRNQNTKSKPREILAVVDPVDWTKNWVVLGVVG